MNSDAPYSYENPVAAPAPSVLLPFALLATSFALILVWQLVNIAQQGSSMKQTKVQMTEVIGKREALVKQSAELQVKLQAVVVDLLELAKTDKEAEAIVKKYNISQGGPAAAGQ